MPLLVLLGVPAAVSRLVDLGLGPRGALLVATGVTLLFLLGLGALLRDEMRAVVLALRGAPEVVLTADGLRDHRAGGVLLPWSLVERAHFSHASPAPDGASPETWHFQLTGPAPEGLRAPPLHGLAGGGPPVVEVKTEGLAEGRAQMHAALERFAPHVDVGLWADAVRDRDAGGEPAPLAPGETLAVSLDGGGSLLAGALGLLAMAAVASPLALLAALFWGWGILIIFAAITGGAVLLVLAMGGVRLVRSRLRGPVLFLGPDGFRDLRLGDALVPWGSVHGVKRRVDPWRGEIWEFHLDARPPAGLRTLGGTVAVRVTSLQHGSERMRGAVAAHLPHLQVALA